MHTYIHTYVHTYIHTYMYVHTAPHSTLVSLLCVWAASSGLSALPRASWEAFLELDTYLPTCLMYSTGCPFSNGSYSVLVPWSGGISWVLLRPTSEIIAVPPRAPEVAVHSDHRNRGYSLFLSLVHPQPRLVHSRWL